MAETLRTRGLFLVAPHSLTLVCTRKIANFPVSEPIYTSSLPCFKCIEILLFGSGRFVPVPFMCHPWACFPFTLACSLQPLSPVPLPWTTLAASAVGVLPSGLVSSFSVCCQESLHQPTRPLFLHVLPGATVKNK